MRIPSFGYNKRVFLSHPGCIVTSRTDDETSILRCHSIAWKTSPDCSRLSYFCCSILILMCRAVQFYLELWKNGRSRSNEPGVIRTHFCHVMMTLFPPCFPTHLIFLYIDFNDFSRILWGVSWRFCRRIHGDCSKFPAPYRFWRNTFNAHEYYNIYD